MSFLKELFNSMARVIGRIIAYLLIGFLLFYFFNNNVNAATWVEFRQEGDEYLCGTNQDSLSCTYSTNVIGYNVIIEQIELKPNKSYQLEIYWNLQTAITPGNQSGYINDNNWRDFTATIDGKFAAANGDALPSENRTWQKLSQERIFGIGDVPDYASYYYKYTNVFDIPSDKSYQRLFFAIRKRQQWISIGMPTWYTQVYTPLVVFTEFTYVLTEIGDNGVSNIIASGNKNTEDIINNQNQNQQQTNEGLQDIEDALLDTTQPNLENFNYTDATGGLISTFLTMPITLLRVMNNVDSCRSITLGELFGTPLRFDCVNPGSFLGETLWNIIDYFIVFTMITSIAQLFIYVYEKFKNLDDFFNEFYTPQHMAPDEYIPKHGGGN